jgi:ABC-type branched-subunit amino acid transport system ATPase component/branched-subunit amino acid ABC-type transport system permease component
MREFLTFVIVGLTGGSIYGLAGVGLVLTYKTSGIFNFAHGSVGAMAVFVFYWLHVDHGMAWPLAALISLGAFAPAAGVLLERMARALDGASAALKVVATVGLLLIVAGVGNIWYGGVTRAFPGFLPAQTFEVGGVFIGWDQLITVIISLVATTALYIFFRRARLGVAMRGVVDNPELLAMTGERPLFVRRIAWILGSMFASASGLLLAPNLSLNGLVLTEIVIQAFAAAAIGFFSSLPLTYAGGLFVGVATAVTANYTNSISGLSGLATGLPFAILFLVLICTPRARLVERRLTPTLPVRQSWYAPGRVRLVFGAAFVAFLCFVPQFAGAKLTTWSDALVYVVIFLSLGLLVRTSGQVSLCHAGFAAVGAASMSHFASSWHLPWLVALVLAGLVAVPVGAFVAIPAIRLSGVYLALATFGFGVLLNNVFYTTGLMFGEAVGGIPVPRPAVKIGPWDLSTDTGFYYVLLVLTIITAFTMYFIHRGRLGRLLRALGDSPIALETHGATPNVTRVLVFCISAFFAAVGGALFASLYQFASGDQFSYLLSLQLIALLVIVVAGEPWYAVVAAAGFVILPGYLDIGGIFNYLTIAFGVFAATFAMSMDRAPQVPVALRRVLDRLGGRATGGQVLAPTAAAIPAPPTSKHPSPARVEAGDPGDARSTPGLDVRDLSVRFGGVHAVEHLVLSATGNGITGLIGPNGAGKTTTFAACCGLLRPSHGKVLLHGNDVSRLGPAARARRGLGRTFQRVELFHSLTVRDNVALGCEAPLAGGNPLTQIMSRPRDRAVIERAVDDALSLVGIEHLSNVQAGLLPTGQRRLVEMARVLAGPFDMLLLDEPSSGLDASETEHLGNILLELVRTREVGVLLVEHDMALVRQVCNWIYVLDFGQLIFEGTPDEISTSEVVRAAYLGSESTGTSGAGSTLVKRSATARAVAPKQTDLRT